MISNNNSWVGHCGLDFVSFTLSNSNHNTVVLKNIKGYYELYFTKKIKIRHRKAK